MSCLRYFTIFFDSTPHEKQCLLFTTRFFAAFDTDREEYAGCREPGRFLSRCKIPGFLLSPGRFMLSAVAGITGIKNVVLLENVLLFDVEDTGATGSDIAVKRLGIIRPKLEWEVEALRQC